MSQPDELRRELVVLADYWKGTRTSDALRAADDRIERLEAQQAAALELHQPEATTVIDDDGCAHEVVVCSTCSRLVHPCPTRRALTEDTP